MRLLVLGGTVFLSRAVAVAAAGRGHDVTIACRGESGTPPEGVRHLALDRAAGPPPPGEWDAVVDVARLPSWVRAALTVVPDAHWVFVSTINVYPDTGTPGASPAALALHPPMTTDRDLAEDPEAYGPMKVACEQLVESGSSSSMGVRPGLVVGPGDPSGRFTYWPWRLARPGPVLAPGSPVDPVQVVDVRDLAEWLVDSAEQRRTGTYDGVGPVQRRGDLLAEVAAGVGVQQPDLVWADQQFLLDHTVQPWAGPRSLPLWLPLPEYDGLMTHDADLPRAAGLRTRPVSETARDTLAWLADHPEAPVAGLTQEEETELLDALRA